MPDFVDFIDLMEVHPGAPNRPSLKMLGGRLHSRRIQELPIEHDAHITEDDRPVMRGYVFNDLCTTEDLYHEVKPQLDLREQMSQMYGVDLRSKSDPQIAEAVLKHEVEKELGRKVYKPDLKAYSFKYRIPDFIRFETPILKGLLEEIRATDFVVDPSGTDAAVADDDDDLDSPKAVAKKKSRLVGLPKSLSRDLHIGSTVYQMGIGGLHSKEKSRAFVSNDKYVLKDRDVTSYYPAIIINQGLFPAQLGETFLRVYTGIRDRRIRAKKDGDKPTMETLKLTLNGSFGKFGSKWSALCSPELLIQTTVTGQLSILMLIERLELGGFKVISANTDGIVTYVERARESEFECIVFDWELDTDFGTEEVEYKALYSRDVNTYVAVKMDGKAKLKGAVCPSGPGQPAAAGMKRNPTMQISIDAAVKFITEGVPPEETIYKCHDIRQFISIRRVTGGAMLNDVPVGKIVRYYYSTDSTEPLLYVKSGNKVPRTEGVAMMMEFPDDYSCPDDVDREHYVRESYAILEDIGFGSIDPDLRSRTGLFTARLADEKNFHTVDAATGKAVCGKSRKSLRDKWIEVKTIPVGHRMCPHCKKADDL